MASLFLFWLWSPLGWLGTIATVWCAYFFRDPERVTPVRDGIVVAPADGRVSRVANAVPPTELGLGERPLPRVSIFMSVFDCHVNRSPVAGKIERIVYRPGAFVNADLDKASEDNERNASSSRPSRARIGVVQIAGLVARRIVCFVREGATVGAGERIGMIRFGSRVDVYLPDGVRPLVAEGQTAIAGETVHRRSARRRSAAHLPGGLAIGSRAASSRHPGRSLQPACRGRTGPVRAASHSSAMANRCTLARPRRPLYCCHAVLAVRPRSPRARRRRFRAHPGAHAAAQPDHAAGAVRGTDRDPARGSRESSNGRWPRSSSPRCSTASTAASRACSRARRGSAPSSTASPISSISAWRLR